MRRLVLTTLMAVSMASAIVAAQRYARQTEPVEYTLTVERDAPAAVNGWWKPFVQDATRAGYCFELPTMPLVDRPQLGDKAAVLKVAASVSSCR